MPMSARRATALGLFATLAACRLPRSGPNKREIYEGSVLTGGDAFIVTVQDDGVGFDPAAPQAEDGRSHVGIKNVRGRLQAMCGGSLTLTSGSGSGTTVALKIPKGDEAAK